MLRASRSARRKGFLGPQKIYFEKIISGKKEKKSLAKPSKTVKVHVDGNHHEAAVFDRQKLCPGDHFYGPAIVLQDDTTTVVLHKFTAYVDGAKNLILTANEIQDASR